MSARARKVAIVTGSSKGIGRFLSNYLLGQGIAVLGCSRGASDLAEANYEHLVADITDEQQVIRLFRHVRQIYGRLDILINNAGVAAMNLALLTPGSSGQAIINTNLLGTFLACREAAKLMLNARSGRIVNLTSVAVPMRLEGESLYAASKSAVETFTRIFAREVAPYGITVNAVGPSPIETDLIRGVPKSNLDALIGRLAIKRLGTFEDVANVIDFFIRPKSDYITGQVIYLGGEG